MSWNCEHCGGDHEGESRQACALERIAEALEALLERSANTARAQEAHNRQDLG